MKSFKSIQWLIVLVLLSGCSSIPKGDVTYLSKPLEPSVKIKFADIPVPSGFKFIYNESYSFQAHNTRVAVLKYRGRADGERTFLFFKEQMPIYGWILLNTIEYGKQLLNFEKENEICIVTIEPKKLSTEISISLGPKQMSPVKKETKETKIVK